MANDSLSSLYKELLFGGWSLVALFYDLWINL